MKPLATLIFLAATAAYAQRPAVPTAPVQPPLKGSLAGYPAWPVARPEDVRSIKR